MPAADTLRVNRAPVLTLWAAVVAAPWEPEELNRIGFRLYERFRPEVPEGVKGWGAKGEFSLAAVAAAADAA